MNRQYQINYKKCIVDPKYIAIAPDPALIASVCGNSIVVFVRDKIRRIGGVAHYIYPKQTRKHKASNYYANVAIQSLIQCMINHNAYMYSLEAHLFGGGSLRGYARDRANKTIKITRNILKKLKIDIISEDIGGSVGRKVLINTHSGEVVVYKTHRIRDTDWAPESDYKFIS